MGRRGGLRGGTLVCTLRPSVLNVKAGSRCGCHMSLQAEWIQQDILSTWLRPQGLGPPSWHQHNRQPGPRLAWGWSGRAGGSPDRLECLLAAQSRTGLPSTWSILAPTRVPKSWGGPHCRRECQASSQAAVPSQRGQFSRFWGFDLTRWLHLHISWSQNLSLGARPPAPGAFLGGSTSQKES